MFTELYAISSYFTTQSLIRSWCCSLTGQKVKGDVNACLHEGSHPEGLGAEIEPSGRPRAVALTGEEEEQQSLPLVNLQSPGAARPGEPIRVRVPVSDHLQSLWTALTPARGRGLMRLSWASSRCFTKPP